MKWPGSQGLCGMHMGTQASCDHGFASYIGHVLYRDVLGISRINYISKEVTVRFSDIALDKCSGVIPVEESSIELKWERTDNQIRYSVKVPSGYQLHIEKRKFIQTGET